MVGQARRYCQSDNMWSGQQPQCVPVTCNPTDHLENGKINYAYPLVYNSTVEYSCDFGFKLVGPSRRICGPDRRLLGEAPQCQEIDCGEIGPLNNGHIKGFSTRMGDKKRFHCLDGMKFQGESFETVCLESGRWSHPLPLCLGPCTVPQVEHASKVYVIQPDLLNAKPDRDPSQHMVLLTQAKLGEKTSHGSFLEIVCEDNYELDEQMDKDSVIQAPVCNNSTWSYEPKCKPASCKSTPPSPKNGRVRVASIEHGSKGYIHCLDGFRLKGSSTSECIMGNWTEVDSQCIEIFCAFPGYIDHGRVLLVGLTGMYDYKPYIKRISNNRQIAYECDPGFHVNDGAPSGATCMDGQWKPEGLPTCIKE